MKQVLPTWPSVNSGKADDVHGIQHGGFFRSEQEENGDLFMGH
jgi:hypothetical protein